MNRIISYGAAMLKPFHDSNRRRAGHAGKLLDETTEKLITKATDFDGRYLNRLGEHCEFVRSEGMPQPEGIFEAALEDVYCELQIDPDASLPGYELQQLQRRSDPARQNIWQLLADSQQNKAYRQLAILAWGGYGKTTLLRHVAYCYGTGNTPPEAPKLVPVLLVLRKYSKIIVQENSLTLPALINQHYIKSLPESEQLQPTPPNWAKDLLKQGRGLVMFDGFDEVPLAERPVVAKWLTEQMQQYAKSVFVVTSRPKAYKEQTGANRLVMKVPLWVQPFDPKQRRDFVQSWYLAQEKLRTRKDTSEVKSVAANAAQELIAQIEQTPELVKMAKNPLLLTMICTFHRRKGGDLPKRRVDLYEKICQLLLVERADARKIDSVLLGCQSHLVLAQVAFGMMQRDLTQVDGNVRIDETLLLAELAQTLAAQGESIEATEFLKDVRDISELMIKQEDEYEFAHLSFQEYFAAVYVDAKPAEREPLLFAQLDKDFWKGTVLLYAGKTMRPSKLIREAMAQGKPELAYECLQQTTKRVDAELQAELQALSSLAEQVVDARYADLERYLKNGQWEKADKETDRLMITEVGKEDSQWFDRDDLLNFPCEPLRAIDGLWVKHSGGKFGFSVQKKIYLSKECGGIPDGKYHRKAWDKFCHKNGWQEDNMYVEVRYDLASPVGHLPVGDYIRNREKDILFSRTQTCEL
jgi:hypothetical protein